MNRRTMLLAIVLMTALVAMGCSGGGDSPVTPTTEPGITASSINTGPTQTHLWGYYDVYIDIENQMVEAALNRTVMFAVNVVTFMNGNPAAMIFTINGTPTGPDYVDVDIDVGLKHPLPGMTQYNGYDVRGIFVADGDGALAYDSGLNYAVAGTDQYMFNADGYARWWNPGEFTTPGVLGYTHGDLAAAGFTGDAALNPYKYFADNLGATDDLWTFLNANAGDNGVFTSGTTNTRNYLLRFPNSKGVKYGYAIVANWGGEDPTFHPSNAVESPGINASVTPDIYWVDAGDNGGDLILDIDVFSWNYQPSTIFVESNVFSGAYELTTEMSPTGGDDNYSTYHVEIPSTSVTSTLGNEFWVVCQYDGFDYSNNLGVSNGAGADLLAAFFREDLYVHYEPYSNPVACFTFAADDLCDIAPAGTAGDPIPTEWNIDFDATCSVDANTYDWDFDGDGTYEFTGDTSPLRSYEYTVPGTYNATLRLNGNIAYLYPLPIVIAQSIFVDGDNAGSEDGSQANPWNTIVEGISAAAAGQIVRVDAAGDYDEGIVLVSDVSIIGDNWNGGTGRPLLRYMRGSGVSNILVWGMEMDTGYQYSSQDYVMFYLYSSSCSNVTLRCCRFSQVIYAHGSLYGIWVAGGTGITHSDITLEYNEVVNLGSTDYWGWSTNTFALRLDNCTNAIIRNNEIHHINHQSTHNTGDARDTRTHALYSSTCPDSQITNNLIYDVYDLSDADGSTTYHKSNDIYGITCWNSPGAVVANNTVDDFNPVARSGSQAGASIPFRIGDAAQTAESYTVKNNIASNMVGSERTGFPLEYIAVGYYAYFTTTVTYSNAWNIDDSYAGGEYYDLAIKGTGSFDNTDNEDPGYDMTPGANYYHVTNGTLVSDDATEMGAFGGPGGDWLPPSQW